MRFDSGHTGYIEVLDTERSLINAELSQVQTKGSLFQALVSLFKAMGGGWVLEIDHLMGTTAGLKISINGFEVIYANE